ncbi:MAG: MFS transporter [Rhabdochlamydiaceae bacterium]|nr:MFS transporter [Rhabdochlamydiaceae bacterium]
MHSETRKILFPYSIVVLLAYIAFSMPLPILPEMFLDPTEGILSQSYSLKQKTILLGFVMASFPLGQFFGSPILGHCSDLYGRKKVILLSLMGTVIGYLVTAMGVMAHSVAGMFCGLMICGFCEGNVTIAQSVIADLTTTEKQKEEKAVHFGWLNVVIALGFIIGPLMGGQLADRSLVSWFTYATPFWMGAILTLLCIAVIYFASQETLKARGTQEWHFIDAVMSGFKKRGLRLYFLGNFFLALGYFSYFRFLPVFLERMFDFSAAQLGYVMVYNSIAIALGVICLIPPLSRRIKPVQQLAIFSIFLAGSFVLCLQPENPYYLLATLPPVGLCLAITITNGSLVISNAASSDFQGGALGTLTSVQVLAEFFTGVFGGVLAAQTLELPLYIGAFMTVISGLIFGSVSLMRGNRG